MVERNNYKIILFLFGVFFHNEIQGQFFNGEINCEFIRVPENQELKNDTFFVKYSFCKDTMIWSVGKEIGYQINNKIVIDILDKEITNSLTFAEEKINNGLPKKSKPSLRRYLTQIKNDGYNVFVDENKKFKDSENIGSKFNLFFQKEGFFLDYIMYNEILMEERIINSIDYKNCNCEKILQKLD